MSDSEHVRIVYGKSDVVTHLGLPEGKASEYLVIPLTEELIARFLMRIPENYKEYGITDSKNCNGSWHRSVCNVHDFNCDYVIDGKFVNIFTFGHNFFGFIDMVTFSGDRVCAWHLYSRFLAYVTTQDFEKMKEVAGQSISDKLKRDMFNYPGMDKRREIEEFYKL